MAGLYRLISFTFWVLGLLTTVAVLAARIIRPLLVMAEDKLEIRSLLWFAGVLFLGAIATHAIQRSSKS